MPFEEKAVAHQMLTVSREIRFFGAQLTFTVLEK